MHACIADEGSARECSYGAVWPASQALPVPVGLLQVHPQAHVSLWHTAMPVLPREYLY